MTINHYPKIYNLGHACLMGDQGILDGEIIVEEKIDGSCFSMDIVNNELTARSKGAQLIIEAPEKMFVKAVETAKKLSSLMIPNLIYRGEFLKTPKHNALSYDRTPKEHVILFDIDNGMESYFSYEKKTKEAERLGLEVVPLLFKGDGKDLTSDLLKSFLDKTSILGGVKIEGVVVKNYSRFGKDGKVLMGKHVSEAFKEVHKSDWKKSNPSNKDIIFNLIEEYRSKARWQKAILHLDESGVLTNSPKDIGNLIKEVQKDVEEECIEEIKQKLWIWAKGHVMRGIINGVPEFYKEKLLERQFEKEEQTKISNSNLEITTLKEML